MKIALCLSNLPLSGVGTSLGIIRTGLMTAANDVDVVIKSGSSGGDSERAKRDCWSGVAEKAYDLCERVSDNRQNA